MKARFHATTLAVLFMLGLSTWTSSAATIFWGSQHPDFFYTSTGASLDSEFVFEVGTFDTTGGWTPNAGNLSEWAARWMLFDRATVGAGWNANDQNLDNVVNHTVTGASSALEANASHIFTQGTQAYLWVYNTQIIDVGAEWALLADFNKGANVFGNSLNPAEQFVAWEFPDPSLQGGESYDWQTRDLDTPIFGGVNGVQGDGAFSVNPGVFTIQTHAVPEPGSALLLLLAGGAGFLRRRHCPLKNDLLSLPA
jgi:hypothetical protein